MEVDVLLERGNILLEQGRYVDAEKLIKQALELDPDNDYALSMMGRCYLNNKKLDKGIEMVNRALAIDPNNSFYFYLLGFGYYHKNETMQAETNLRKAIELNPYAAEYFGLLAFVILDQKQFERALEKANEGLALAADNITCLNARSTALNKLRRIDDAAATMGSALAQDPDNAVTHTIVGWNLLERGDNKKALEHFMEALKIDPDYESARSGMKEALKSRILPYKWLLQYSFWVSNKGRSFQTALPIIIYVVFRIIVGISKANENTADYTSLIVAIYILIIVTSWTINSIANFLLLFHPTGKYALSNTEKWSAINVVTVLILGITIMLVSYSGSFAKGTSYESGLFFAGMVCFSMALPLGNIQYPISFEKKNWRDWLAHALVVAGALSLLIFAILPGIASGVFIVYGLAFLVYNWSGVGR